jgi:hypothetical protein
MMSRRRALLGIKNKIHPPPIGTLLVDCPLNGDGLDISGNNYHLTPSVQAQWATVGGRQVFYSPSSNFDSYLDLLNPQQNTYINDFRLEIEICRLTNTGSNAVFIDGCGASGSARGLYNQTQHVTTPTFYQLGFNNAGGGVLLDYTPLSDLVIGKWYRSIFQKKGADVYLAIYDIDNNVFLQEYTETMIANLVPTYNYIRIGTSIGAIKKPSQGYLRNLKIWVNLI